MLWESTTSNLLDNLDEDAGLSSLVVHDGDDASKVLGLRKVKPVSVKYFTP